MSITQNSSPVTVSILVLVAVLFWPWSLLSAETLQAPLQGPRDYSLADDVLGDDMLEMAVPIVLSASRLRQPASESPASITVLDRDLIEKSGARSVVDLLMLVPGFQVSRLVNGDAVATYHGMAERYNPRLQLLVDGRPTYIPLYGGIPWSELPLAVTDIERIEVIRAPNAATFGPNSYYGVISITTLSPETTAGWQIDGEAGGNDYIASSIRHTGTLGDNPYRFTLRTERDEGFKNIPDREKATIATFQAGRQLSAMDKLTFATGLSDGGHIELDTVVEPDDLDRFQRITNGYVQLVWERDRAVDDSTRLQYYYNYYDVDDRSLLGYDLGDVTADPTSAGIGLTVDLDRNANSTRHEVEIQKTSTLASGQRLVYGGALRHDTVQGQFIFADHRQRNINTGRVFAHTERALSPAFLLSGGVLLEQNSVSGFNWSPRLSLIYRQSTQRHFRLSYSRAARTPLLLEEKGMVLFNYQLETGQTVSNYFIFDNETIEPEYIDVVDLGLFSVQPESGLKIDGKLSWQRMNHRVRTDTIQYAPDTFDGISKFFRNGESYDLKTLEFDIAYRPRRGTRTRLAYSYAFDINTLGGGGEPDLAPRHTLSLFASQELPREVTASAEYYYISDWIWDDVRDYSNVNRLDLRLKKNWQLAGLDASVAVQAELELGKNVSYLRRNEVDDLYFLKLELALP